MKLADYQQMMAHLTRPKFNSGGSVGSFVKPKRGLVDEPGSYAGEAVISNPSEFIQEVKIGNKIKYRVRHRVMKEGKRTQIQKFFNNLEDAEKFRDENLSKYMGKKLTQEKFKELRLKNKDLTAKEFANYLNKETSYKPNKPNALKFTEGNVLGFHARTGLPSPSTISEEIKTKIYNDYIKGETNLADLGRKYFGDEKGLTNNARQRRVFSILVGKGVDRSKFRKNFPLKEGEVTSRLKTQYTRKKRINEALNKAGKKTRTQYLDLERKILSLNDDILKMSDKEILNNKFLMKALNVDASKNNLAKGKITFDKYANLSPKEQVAKIRDLAKRRLFFQPEHIREVATELQNIIYHNNISVASGKIGHYMTNIKEYVRNNPKGKAIPAIEAFLKEFDMAVSEGNNKLGFKNIIYDSKAGTSNVVESIKAKSQILKQPSRGGVILGSNIGLLKGVGETLKAIPTPTGAVALNLAFQPDLSSGIDRAALGAEAAFAPELVRQTSRVSSAPIVQRFFNLGLSPQLAARAARVVSPLGLATLAGEGVYQLGRLGAEQRRRMQGMTPEQRRLFDAEQQSISEFAAAGGGIAKLAGKESGPPPEKGPDSEGLASLLKNVKKR